MKKHEKVQTEANEHKLVRKWGKLNMRAGWVGFPSAVMSYSFKISFNSAAPS